MNPNIQQIYKKIFQRTKLPPLEIELILAHVLKKLREFVLAHPEYKLTPKQISNFKFQISKRIKGLPLAYITGHKEFYGLDFIVNKNVLIPRPETELMVEEALKVIKTAESRKQKAEKNIIIDVGTGSGCVIITLAKILKDAKKDEKKSDLGYPKSDFLFIATDFSRPALVVASQNAKLHHVDKIIKFFHSDLLEQILKSKILNLKSKIIILANLPYLTPTQIKNSPTIKYEPKNALNGGRDSLKYYRQLFNQIKTLSMLCVTCYVLCEIDPSQTQNIKKLIKKELPQATTQIKKDLCGRNRLIETRNKRI